MFIRLLCFALLIAFWWALLWLVLPTEWLLGTLPSLVSVHVMPPLLAVTAWWTGKQAWNWRKVKAKERAKKIEAAEKEAAREVAKAAHREKSQQYRAFVECRAVWAALINLPKWAAAGTDLCVLLKQSPKTIQGSGSDVALISSLQQVFAAAFEQCEALVWLPIMLASNDPLQPGWIEQAWRQAVAQSSIEHYPSQPDCAVLPGRGDIPDRLIALFENYPDQPAIILVGMASPLAETDKLKKPDPALGHAVTALLLSRPGLIAPDEAQTACISEDKANDPLLPHWEREQALKVSQAFLQWGKIPLTMTLAFLKSLPPIATLHRANTIHNPAPRQSVQTRQIQESIQMALICAGLRELPFEEEEPKGKQAKPEEPALLDLGWLVHNATPDNLGSLIPALMSLGCELSPIGEASNVVEEHGDIGEARGMLMLAESLIRAAQLEQPVLMARFDKVDGITIGLALPASKNAPADSSMPDQQLGIAA